MNSRSLTANIIGMLLCTAVIAAPGAVGKQPKGPKGAGIVICEGCQTQSPGYAACGQQRTSSSNGNLCDFELVNGGIADCTGSGCKFDLVTNRGRASCGDDDNGYEAGCTFSRCDQGSACYSGCSSLPSSSNFGICTDPGTSCAATCDDSVTFGTCTGQANCDCGCGNGCIMNECNDGAHCFGGCSDSMTGPISSNSAAPIVCTGEGTVCDCGDADCVLACTDGAACFCDDSSCVFTTCNGATCSCGGASTCNFPADCADGVCNTGNPDNTICYGNTTTPSYNVETSNNIHYSVHITPCP